MAIWIDVRTQEEYAQGHIEGALLIPYEEIGVRISRVTEERDADIRVYCKSGRRSEVAKETLQAIGYRRVINEGGFVDLLERKAQGDPIP